MTWPRNSEIGLKYISPFPLFNKHNCSWLQLHHLQLYHREHPDWLHHCLEWQLLGLRPQGTTEGSAYDPVHHWGQASCHPGPIYFLFYQASRIRTNSYNQWLPLTTDFYLVSSGIQSCNLSVTSPTLTTRLRCLTIKLSKIPATLVIDCSLCFHTASGTGAPSQGPKGFLTASTPKS